MPTKCANQRLFVVSLTLPCLVGLLAGACSENDRASAKPTAPTAKTISVRFGVYTSEKPTAMYKKFRPALAALESAMSTKLAGPVHIELMISNSYQRGLRSLLNGEVDFMRIGAASYLQGLEAVPGLKLLAAEKKKGKTSFPIVVAARKDSRIGSASQLRGARFAFGSAQSTSTLLAKAWLAKAGVGLVELASGEYLGRHDLVAAAVERSDFDAGSAKLSSFKSAIKSGSVHVVHTWIVPTKAWVARDHLSPEIVAALEHSLLHLVDKKALTALRVSGFFRAGTEHYNTIRSVMDFVAATSRSRADKAVPRGLDAK